MAWTLPSYNEGEKKRRSSCFGGAFLTTSRALVTSGGRKQQRKEDGLRTLSLAGIGFWNLSTGDAGRLLEASYF
jgi:hypothetical protein